jgi:hypothetical protein
LCVPIESGDDDKLVGRLLLTEISLPYNYKVEGRNNKTEVEDSWMGKMKSFRRDQLHPSGSKMRSFFLGEVGRNCMTVKGKRSHLISNENGTFLGSVFVTDYENGVRKRARKFFQAPSNVPLSEIGITITN